MDKSFTAFNPRLSVIVPVLNEESAIVTLLENLAAQENIAIELILCDGGSMDNTLTAAKQLAAQLPFPMRILRCTPGRGAQMNAGAEVATADYLLFLHADSSFPANDTLAYAINALEKAANPRIVGHFTLRFRGESCSSPFWYYFHTCKAGLHRPGCTHGDQGWLLHRCFFAEIGPFAESLPFMEDARLAPLIADRGQWLLFDREIITSNRRFESEGLNRRQALNALIVACHETGFDSLLAEMPAIYRQQQETGTLSLRPFIFRFRSLATSLAPTDRSRHWRAVGRFITENAWQTALFIDTRRNFKTATPLKNVQLPTLKYFDRYLSRYLEIPALHYLVGQAVRLALAVATLSANLRTSLS